MSRHHHASRRWSALISRHADEEREWHGALVAYAFGGSVHALAILGIQLVIANDEFEK